MFTSYVHVNDYDDDSNNKASWSDFNRTGLY